VRRLLERHLAFAHEHTPIADVHALGIDGLLDPAISFFSFRRGGEVLGTGALKQLDTAHAEIKSMHTAAEVRGQGIGAAMLAHLLETARQRGMQRVSLETGSMAAFASARALYARAGFVECGPFGDYVPSPNSAFMTLALADGIAPK
jgi:putative acetyltransferase